MALRYVPIEERPGMTFAYFIIEHPTRGVVADIDYDFGWKIRFTTADRTDDKCVRYYSVHEAAAAFAKIPYRLRRKCKVLGAPSAYGGRSEWMVVHAVSH